MSSVFLPPLVNSPSEFTSMPLEWPKRFALSIQGPTGEGKTSTSFSAPAPIGYINFDNSWKRARERFKDVDIQVVTIDLPEIPEGASPEKIQSIYEPVWAKFLRVYNQSLSTMRTTVVDTFTTAYGVCRLADLGSTRQVKGKQFAYAPVNEEMKRVVDLAEKYESNLILLHHERAEWGADDKKTGKLEFSGWERVHDNVGDSIRCFIEDGQFRIKMLKSKTRPQLTGKVYPTNSVVDVALDLYPETLPMDWI